MDPFEKRIRTLKYKAVIAALVIILISIQGCRYVSSDTYSPTVSGTFVSNFTAQYGNSTFTILYSYPGDVNWGSNFTMNALFEVNELNGLKEFLGSYGLIVSISGSSGYVAIGKMLGGYPINNNFLYAGSHWGPTNVTVQLNRSDFGYYGQENFNATVSLQFVTEIQLSNSINGVGGVESETNSTNAGSINILSPTNIPASNHNYLILGGIIVAVLALVVISWLSIRRRNERLKKLDT